MSHESPPRLVIAQALFLKGVADAATVAGMTGFSADVVDAELASMQDGDLVEARNGRASGFALTPEGTFIRKSMLADEIADTVRRQGVESAYQDFLGFNHDLLTVCTAWQLRPDAEGTPEVNDHSDTDYDAAVIADLMGVHKRVSGVLSRLTAALSRFEHHAVRLQNALDRLRAGDHDYFTKPLFPSYHTCWFELHEDLLATLGTERRKERSLQ